MNLDSPRMIAAGGLLAAAGVRAWMSTIDCRIAYYDPTVDPVHRDGGSPKIFIFWHEYILGPVYVRGHCRMAMLVSRHRDAEWLQGVARYFGFDCVRGSTYRGGVSALRQMAEKSKTHHLVITPDGPRGPRRKLAQGPVFLASTLGLPLVGMGLGYDRPWRMRTWDRFAIPRPGSRGRAVVSPALHIPPNLQHDGLEHYRLQVERLLNRLTLEAEAWAESGTAKIGELPARREHPDPRWRRIDAAHALRGPHAAAAAIAASAAGARRVF
jgi:lysophospholipid acyltransferase (LPLAT)-like uncharacterized protein